MDFTALEVDKFNANEVMIKVLQIVADGSLQDKYKMELLGKVVRCIANMNNCTSINAPKLVQLYASAMECLQPVVVSEEPKEKTEPSPKQKKKSPFQKGYPCADNIDALCPIKRILDEKRDPEGNGWLYYCSYRDGLPNAWESKDVVEAFGERAITKYFAKLIKNAQRDSASDLDRQRSLITKSQLKLANRQGCRAQVRH